MLYLLTIAPFNGAGFGTSTTPSRATPTSTAIRSASRALGAHQNGIETFPFFAVAVLLAEFRAGPQRLIDELAVLFLIVRHCLCADLSRQPPDACARSCGRRLCDQHRDLLHAGVRRWLPA